MNPELWGPAFWKTLTLATRKKEEEEEEEEKKEEQGKNEEDDEEKKKKDLGIDHRHCDDFQTEVTVQSIAQKTGVDKETAKKALFHSNNDATEAIVRILEQQGNTLLRSDVELVMLQTHTTRDAALQSLLRNNFDLVNSIVELTIQ